MTVNALESKIDGLIKKLKSKKVSERRGAAFALTKVEPMELVYLLKASAGEKSDIRAEILRSIGECSHNEALVALTGALTDKHMEIRKVAAVGLGKIKNRAAVESLCHALKDESAEVRKEAAWSLFKIRDQKAVLPLTQMLMDSDKFVRIRAATILGEFADTQAIPSLEQALHDEADVVVEAMRALGKILGSSVREHIAAMEQHPDPRISAAAREVMDECAKHDAPHAAAG